MSDETKIVGIKVTADASNGTQSLKAMEDASGSLLGGLSNLEGGLGLVASAAGVMAGAFATIKMSEYIKDATLLAARYETLGVVMTAVGKNAGYSTGQMEGYAQGIAKMGISQEASRSAAVKMTQANVDMSKSSDLARIAQDAAVIANTNSSDAFERMTTGIATGQAIILHHMGLMVNFEKGYKDLADTLGKTTTDLTEHEKTTARVAEVQKAGTGIAGSYEAAMSTMGKQINSVKRYHDDLAISIGDVFKPAAAEGVSLYTEAIKKLLKLMQDNKGTLDGWGSALGELAHGVAVAAKGMIPGMDHSESGGLQNLLPLSPYGYLWGGRAKKENAELLKLQQWKDGPKSLEDERDNYAAAEFMRGMRNKPEEKKPTEFTDTTDQTYAKYTTAFDALNKQISQGNPYLTEYDKGMEGIYATIGKLSDEMPMYTKTWNAAGEALEHNLKLTWQLKNAQEEYFDALEKSDAYQNQVKGQLGTTRSKGADGAWSSQQDRFDEASMRSTWAASTRKTDEDGAAAGLKFRGVGRDDGALASDLARISEEEQMYIRSYAMQTDSFTEFERRKFEIQNQFDGQRVAAGLKDEQRLAQGRQTINNNYIGAFSSVLQAAQTLAGGHNKAMYLATQGAAIAVTFLSTEAASIAALAPPPIGLGPILGAPLAASISIAGYASMAAMAATTIMGMTGGGGSTSTIGQGAGTSNSPIVTQPTSAAATQQQGNVTINISGHVIGEDKWVEENLIPAISQAGTRGVTIQYLN
jgi:hypothetical protein